MSAKNKQEKNIIENIPAFSSSRFLAASALS
jgi:hypothetical protein